MATTRKLETPTAQPVGGSEQKVVKTPRVGGVVLYLHRRQVDLNEENVSYIKCPMMVTKVHFDPNKVDGVVISANPLICGMSGTKRVENVIKGDEDGQWQFRQ